MMTNLADLQILATEVVRAQDSGSELRAFSRSDRMLSMREAYEVSWLVHEARLKAGWKAVGRKIGFTNREMWSLFGVDQPVWSFMYDRTYQEVNPAFQYSISELVQPKIEPEIVLCLRAVPPVGADDADVLGCIEWMAHGIEMVQCHYPDWKFTSTDAVCDSSFHGSLLVGEKQSPGIAAAQILRECAVHLHRGDELVEVGYGRNVLGSPLLAILALIEAIDREGSRYPLVPGEIITTGTMTKAYSVVAGQQWRTEFERSEFPGLTVDFL